MTAASGDSARVRIAPSPTGYFHVGTARTALYNWLVARQSGGTFLLRIEDTDTERNREEWVDGILDALEWLDLGWDGDPVRQSARTDLYAEAVRALAAAGHVYWCGCTREEVDARRPEGAPPGYDGHCRDLGLGPGPGRALRFRVDHSGSTVVDDVVRGKVAFDNSSLEDFVVVKSSGEPLFVLANTVDDMDMGISQVIRGEEHLPNTPKTILIWDALTRTAVLGAPPLPSFAHLPLLVNEKRQKLSKRRDPVALESYRDQGYLAAPLLNYLVLLGWSPADGREVLDRDEMLAEFRLDQVNNSPAYFDVVRLAHFNASYIRSLDDAAFYDAAKPWLQAAGWPRFDERTFQRLAPLVQERVTTMSEIAPMIGFVFQDAPEIDLSSWDKAVSDPQAAGILSSALASYESCDWSSPAIREATQAVGDSHGRKLAKAQAPIRVAVTGRSVGPPLFESLEVLGREQTLSRLRAALVRLG